MVVRLAQASVENGFAKYFVDLARVGAWPHHRDSLVERLQQDVSRPTLLCCRLPHYRRPQQLRPVAPYDPVELEIDEITGPQPSVCSRSTSTNSPPAEPRAAVEPFNESGTRRSPASLSDRELHTSNLCATPSARSSSGGPACCWGTRWLTRAPYAGSGAAGRHSRSLLAGGLQRLDPTHDLAASARGVTDRALELSEARADAVICQATAEHAHLQPLRDAISRL